MAKRNYVVRRGQSILDIASELGVNSQDILNLNPSVKALHPGIVLRTPGSGIAPLNAPKRSGALSAGG